MGMKEASWQEDGKALPNKANMSMCRGSAWHKKMSQPPVQHCQAFDLSQLWLISILRGDVVS